MRGKKTEKPLEIFNDSTTGHSADQRKAIVSLSKQHDEDFRLCGLDKWYWLKFVQTVDEDEGGLIHQFPVHFDQLRYLDYLCRENQKVIVLKARRQLVSWFAVMDMMHDAMFAGTGIPGTYQAFRGAIMSIGETEAQYLIERATKVYHRLPEWMKARSRLITDNKLRMDFEPGGVMQAFPMKTEGPQSFGFTKALFDEMAMQTAARSTWTGLMPTLGSKGKLLAVSTPNGRANFYHKVWTQGDQYKGLKRISITWDGKVRTHNDRGEIVDSFQPQNPAHDQAWYDKEIDGLDKQMIARMYHLSFAAYAGLPVWPEFDQNMHVSDQIEIVENTPVLIGWDFGYHFPAVTFWQKNKRDQYIGVGEYRDYDVGFDKFAEAARKYADTMYDRRKTPELHYVDPAGFQRYHSKSQSGAQSDVVEIKNVWKVGAHSRKVQVRPGIQEIGTREDEGPRLKEVRKLWALRADGRPGIVISDRMPDFIEGCGGGYAYDEKGKSEIPDKNEASHPQDTFQYVKTGHDRRPSGSGDSGGSFKERMKNRRRIGRRTGL